MKAKSYCIAFGCLNNDKDKSLTFFSLPSDIERRQKWLSIVDRPDLLPKAADLRRKTYLVCSAHFDDSSIKIIKHLKEDAVPKMLLPKQSQEGEGSCSEAKTTSPQTKVNVTLLNKVKIEPMEEQLSINTVKNGTQIKRELTVTTTPEVGSLCSESQTTSPQTKIELTTLLHKVKAEPMAEQIKINNPTNITQIKQRLAVPTMFLSNPSLLIDGASASCSEAQTTLPQTKTLLHKVKTELMEEELINIGNSENILEINRKIDVSTMILPNTSLESVGPPSSKAQTTSSTIKTKGFTLFHKVKTEPTEEPININNPKHIKEVKQPLALPTVILPNPLLEDGASASCSEVQTTSAQTKAEVTTLLHRVKIKPTEEQITLATLKNRTQINQKLAVPAIFLSNQSPEGVGSSNIQNISPQATEVTILLNKDKKEPTEEPIINVNTLKYLKTQRKRKLLSDLRTYKLKRQRLDKKILKIKKELGVIYE